MIAIGHEAWLEAADKFAISKQNTDASSNLEAQASKKPINIILKDSKSKVRLRLTPRQYQEVLCKKALDKNVIIYLGTGLGKTYIIVLFLTSPMIGAQISSGRKVAFLAPTQDLVRQQAEYVSDMTPYNVRVYCGRTYNSGIHVDHWKEETWLQQISEIDVLFMTPAIFANAICVGFLKWSYFSAVIFDEVHHACKGRKKDSGSDYHRALSNCRYAPQVHDTRLIGLTASLINHMPKTASDIEEGVKYMEKLMNAEVVTDINVNESMPRFVINSFNSSGLDTTTDILMKIFLNFAKEMAAALKVGKEGKKLKYSVDSKLSSDDKKILAFQNRLNLAACGFSIKPGSFHRILTQLSLLRDTCGLWTLAHICLKLVDALKRHGKINFLSDEIRPIYIDFAAILERILIAISNFLGQDSKEILFEYTQPKLLALLEILKEEYDDITSGQSNKSTFSCIVFVKSRIMVVAICNWLQKVSMDCPEYKFIKANYAIGLAATNTSKWACVTRRKACEQAEMLDNFRKGLLNVIVTTSVLEEGIDLPVCSTVIRFDEAPTFRVYVQSRGRARQSKSSYIVLCKDDEMTTSNVNLRKYNDFEYQLKRILKDSSRLNPTISNPTRPISHRSELDQEDLYVDPEGRFRIDSVIARTILNMYCSNLSKRNPFSGVLQYECVQPNHDTYQTRLFLPAGCPVKSCLGNEKNTIDLANSSSVVATIRALHEANELDEKHAIPKRATEEHLDEILETHNLKPNIENLSKDLEGEVQKVGDRELISFDSKLATLDDCLTRGCSVRQYKMYKIVFDLASNHVRDDTKIFFTNPKYAIIVDQSVAIETWPKQLYNHYGEFRVTYEPLETNMIISDRRKHNEYFNFTHKILTKCCNLNLHREDFKQRCLFYLVPLTTQGKVKSIDPDAFSLRDVDIRESEIVIDHYYYRSGSRPKIYLVKRIHREMDAMSRIPHQRETFYERMTRQYGEDVIRTVQQPVLEVTPISREFAKSSGGKLVKSDYTSRNLFFLQQQVEFFYNDPAVVFQAFNMPEIIYKIYLTATIVEFDRKFVSETIDKRSDVLVPGPINHHGDILVFDQKQADGANETDDDDEDVQVKDYAEEGSDDEQDSDSQTECSSSDSEENFDSSDDDELMPKDQLRDILNRRAFNLRDDDDKRMEQWNLDEYQPTNLQALNITSKNSLHHQRYINSSPRFPSSFGDLETAVNYHKDRILRKLSDIHEGIVTDKRFLGDEKESERLTCRVDLTVEPNLKFDRNTIPLKSGSRVEALLEAMTQRRASSSSNLELLENIGDCYLKYSSSVVLFKLLTDQPEGVMTSARSRLIGNKHFIHLAKKSNLGSYAIANKYDPLVLQLVLTGSSMDNRARLKNVMRPKDLADTFESIVGACLVNGGEFEAILAMKWLGLDIFDGDIFVEFHENAVVFAPPPTALLEPQDSNVRNLFNQNKKRLKRFERILSYEFNDPSHLIQALTHASSLDRCTDSYERLEFLGDAILDFLVTMTLYQAGVKTPGQLTSSRSALVNNSRFARFALKYGFQLFIQHANHDLYDELVRVNERMREDSEMSFFEMVDFDKIVKVLGDVFESVAGAIYLDSGCSLDKVWSIFYPILKDAIDEEVKNPSKNLLVHLYELFPGQDRVKFDYFSTIKQDETLTGACCKIYGFREFYGEGLSKHQARLRAVQEALQNLPTACEKAKLDKEYLERLKSIGNNNNNRGPRCRDIARDARRGGRGGARGMGQRGRGRRHGGAHFGAPARQQFDRSH